MYEPFMPQKRRISGCSSEIDAFIERHNAGKYFTVEDAGQSPDSKF